MTEPGGFPVCFSLLLGLQAHAGMPGFYIGAEDQIQVLMHSSKHFTD